jgi:N-acetylmuramoyl-L-alanine amidase
MKLVISSGHGKYIRGASGYLDEVDEARRVVEEVAAILTEQGHSVETFHDDTSDSQNENLHTIVNYHNSQTRDLDVSVHFNAYSTTSKPMGCECLYVTQSTLAGVISDKMATSLDLPDRGAKYRSDLFFLNSTEEPAVLLEVCFVDSSVDAEHYNAAFEAVCHEIAEALVGQEFDEAPVEPTEPPEAPVDGPSGDNVLYIAARGSGDIAVYVNGALVYGHKRCANTARFRVWAKGDVILNVNGEDFQVELPPEPPESPEEPESPVAMPRPNHTNITTTVFGGASDQEKSAYPPFGYLNDSDLYVSLPCSFDNSLFPDNAPMVRVFHGELSAVGRVADKGPWIIHDESYVHGDTRPIIEDLYFNKQPIPPELGGSQVGKVPTSDAALDVSPALAERIGLDGKGTCSWTFEEGDHAK